MKRVIGVDVSLELYDCLHFPTRGLEDRDRKGIVQKI